MLHQARHDLLLEVGPPSVVVEGGSVFVYFDELRKMIEVARAEVFFVDPYLDAEFVSRYLPYVPAGTTIRLLARKKLQTLLPAVEAFAQEFQRKVHVRSTDGFHDRYLFVDKEDCYQSGASFKDGAKKAPTTITQITDAFQQLLDVYERLWNSAKIER